MVWVYKSEDTRREGKDASRKWNHFCQAGTCVRRGQRSPVCWWTQLHPYFKHGLLAPSTCLLSSNSLASPRFLPAQSGDGCKWELMAKYPELGVWEQVVQTQTLSESLDNPELGCPPPPLLQSLRWPHCFYYLGRKSTWGPPAWLAASLPWKLTFHTPDSHIMLG